MNNKRVATTFDRLNSDVSFLGAPVGCIQNTQDFLTGKDFSAFKMRIELKVQFRWRIQMKMSKVESLRGFSMRTFIKKSDCNYNHQALFWPGWQWWNEMFCRAGRRPDKGRTWSNVTWPWPRTGLSYAVMPPTSGSRTSLLSHHCSNQPNWRHWAILSKYYRFWIPKS